jgi:riboflavin kinase/FMN adenylyltransferase
VDPPVSLSGSIIHGKGLGKTVGMPTANLDITGAALPLPPGVYAVKILVLGEWRIGVTNIGPRPSVDSVPVTTVETLILDFNQDIYGERVLIRTYLFLRPIQKFSGLEEVKAQVERDSLRAREFFKTEAPGTR